MSLGSTRTLASLARLPKKVPPAYDQIFNFFTALSASKTRSNRIGSSYERISLLGTGGTGLGGSWNGRSIGERGVGVGLRVRGGESMSDVISRFRGIRQYATQHCPDCPHQPAVPPLLPSTPPATSTALTTKHPSYLNSLPLSLRRLAAALPTPAGRPPTRDQVLSLTTSFFERLKIRFKWTTIRSYRRFRIDDYSAFFSLGIAGTLTWFLISTTSFLAFIFAIMNSLSLQEWIARKLGDYLTAQTGINIVFESAIVPRWGVAGGGSTILFKNVYVSRGPIAGQLGVLPPVEEDGEGRDSGLSIEEVEERARQKEIMAKWTHFHLSIDTVEVSLSLGRWLDGHGIVREANVTGVRGVVDRSHIRYDPDAPRDRFAYRHVAKAGDFWLESLHIEDFLVTIYQPDNFRPYTFSIFNADIRKLRKQWLFYDLMSADSITGQVDNCLFSLHKPQSIGRTSEEDLKDAQWARMSRFRVDGVPIDHMQTAHDVGVLSWVTSGRCDLVADIRFPSEGHESDLDLSTIVAEIVDKLDKEVNLKVHMGAYDHSSSASSSIEEEEEELGVGRIPGQRILKGDALRVPVGWNRRSRESQEEERREKMARRVVRQVPVRREEGEEGEEMVEVEMEKVDKRVSIDLDIRFKDLKASVPIFTSDLSYVNGALIRPIVAFLNANKTLIPIRCHFDLSLDEFDGSWTTYDCGLLDRTSEQVYAALAHHVQNANNQRLQTVSLWTLRKTAEAVLSTFKRNWGEAERSGLYI